MPSNLGILQKSSLAPGAMQTAQLFAFQSYFDSTNFQKAILPQAPNDQIVFSTQQPAVSTPGYGLALSPASQTPVAVALHGLANNPVVTLVPGQVLWPTKREVPFTGFQWGLPFGWLGGGLANLHILADRDADVSFGEVKTEVIFHRATFKIWQPSELTAAQDTAGWPKNWPMRFPWRQAQRIVSGTTVNQKGEANIAISQPTRTIMQLRTGLAIGGTQAPATMRIFFQGSNDLGLDSAGAVISTFPAFYDVNWPGYTNLGTSGNMAQQIPTLDFSAGPMCRLAADDGTVIFVDASGAAALNTMTVDVVRYGYL